MNDTTNAPAPSARSRVAWVGTLASVAALVVGWVGLEAFVAGALLGVPLLLFTPGTVRGSQRAAVGLCFTSMAAFVHAVLVMTDPAAGWAASLTLVASVLLCFCSTYFVRWRNEVAGG